MVGLDPETLRIQFEQMHANPVKLATEIVMGIIQSTQEVGGKFFVTTLGSTRPEDTQPILQVLTQGDYEDDGSGLIRYTAKQNYWLEPETPTYIYIKNGTIAQISTQKLF